MSTAEHITGNSGKEEVLRVFDGQRARDTLEPEERAILDKHGVVVEHDPDMMDAYRATIAFARSRLTTTFRGETGTGKDLFPKIYSEYATPGKRFISANCAGWNTNLIESALFGHEKGAFTGAHAPQVGLLEAAEEGTVQLDEVGDLNEEAQGKLLHAIEKKSIQRVGGTKDIAIHCAIICSTNKDLEKMVRDGKFRKDLYFRITKGQIFLKSWDARTIEHRALVLDSILQNKIRVEIHPDVRTHILHQRFSGNVRHMESLLERAATFARTKDTSPMICEEEYEKAVRYGSRNIDCCPNTVLDGDLSVDTHIDGRGVKANVQITLPLKHDFNTVTKVLAWLLAKCAKEVTGTDTGAAKMVGINRNTLMAYNREFNRQE